MGKPIAGRNKSPFGVDGINVDAAVLSDGTKLTNVRISKQRSINMFDLISADGETVYPFVKITGVDKDGNDLNISDDSSELADKLANGHFCISIVDTDQNVVGFAIRLLLNKVTLQGGKIFFLIDYSGQGENNSTPSIPVTNVVVTPTTFNMNVGKKLQINALVEPDDATNKNVTWSSNNESIASVSSTGVVTALTNGTVIISATSVDGSLISSSTGTITTLATGVNVTPTTITIEIGDTQQLSTTVLPSTASNKAVTWSSESPNIATVTSTGLVTAISNGVANIVATTVDGAFTNKCICTVSTSVDSVSTSPSTLDINVGSTSQLTATVLPANAANKTVNWTSGQNDIASVNSSGLVTGIANGTTNITATTVDGSFTSSSTVTIKTPVKSVSLSPKTFELPINSTRQLTASILPSTASNKAVTWSSATPSIATVSASGLVTAIASGSAIITVTTSDGSFTDTCTCSVVVGVESVSITPSTLDINVGSNSQLTATVLPANAANKNVTWSSDNELIATVNASGLVSGVSNGSAVITATTVDGSFTSSSTVSVTTKATGVSLNKTSSALEVDQTEQLTTTVLPATASNKSIIWTSNNSNATVSNTGLVTAKVVGTSIITATTVDGSFTATCTYTVTAKTVHPTSITLDKTSEVAPVGINVRLYETVLPSNATNKNVVWSSSDESICTVTSLGVVKGISVGNATVSATTVDGGLVATCNITVEPYIKVQSISVDKPTLVLKVGEPQTVNLTINPSNSNAKINWPNAYPSYYSVVISEDRKSAVFTGLVPSSINRPLIVSAGSAAAEINDYRAATINITIVN